MMSERRHFKQAGGLFFASQLSHSEQKQMMLQLLV